MYLNIVLFFLANLLRFSLCSLPGIYTTAFSRVSSRTPSAYHLFGWESRNIRSRFTQENSETGVTPDNLAYVIYICGSTDQPNGVAIAHSGAVNTLLDINHRFEIGAGDLAPIRSADLCSFGTYAFEPLTPLKTHRNYAF